MPDDAALPELDQLPAVAQTRQEADEQLEAEYYDTDDFRLIRAGITLRRRRGGHDEGWHLKIPADAHSRREISVPLADDVTVPAELADQVKVHTRGKALRPRATITTSRKRVILIDEAGAPLAELAVDEVHATQRTRARTQSSWREVELELTGGDRQVLDSADQLLLRSGLRRSVSSAKFERVVGAERDALPGRVNLSPASPASDVVLAYLADHAEALKSLDPMVRRDEPDAVHQMRVATRRMRSTLQTFGRLIWTADTSHLAAELKWLGGLLGQARDAEVIAGHLLASLSDVEPELVIGPVTRRVHGHFDPAGAKASDVARRTLSSRRYFALLDELDTLLREPGLTPDAGQPARALLPGAARRAYRRTRKRMRAARQSPAGQSNEIALHEARKAAKRARYAAELLTPALGKDPRRFARRMKQIQTLLGDHQDSVIARQVELDLAKGAARAGENAFTYGVLYQRDAEAAGQARAKAAKAWKRATKPAVLAWLA